MEGPPGEAPGAQGPPGAPKVARPAVRVKLAETPAEWAGAVAVRLAVFVDEQGVPLAAEMDEHDRSAVHAIALLTPPPDGAVVTDISPPLPVARATGAGAPGDTGVNGAGAKAGTPGGADGEPDPGPPGGGAGDRQAFAGHLVPARQGTALRAAAQAGKYLPLSLSGARTNARDSVVLAPVVGTGRLLRAAGGVARIGRIAVLPEWRGRGVGSRLLRLLEEAALARGAVRVLVHAQLPALPFYERHGYAAPPPGRPFLEDGIPHVRMTKALSPDM